MTRPQLTWPPVEAVVLDMDGVLIDTQPAWRAAESAVFAGLGIPLSESDLLDSTGQPVEELIPDLAATVARRRPESGRGIELTGTEPTDAEVAGNEPTDTEVTEPTDTEVADRIINRVIAHVQAEGEPMPGVTAAVALFERHGLRLAIASSSPLRMINAVCDRLGLDRIEVRCSAMDEVRGKPAPDVYLTAARRLGVAAAGCLALEDSPNGLASAKAAGMRCVAVPDPLLAADPRYREADLVLESLTGLDEAALAAAGRSGAVSAARPPSRRSCLRRGTVPPPLTPAHLGGDHVRHARPTARPPPGPSADRKDTAPYLTPQASRSTHDSRASLPGRPGLTATM